VRVTRRQRTFHYRGAEIELALDQGEVTDGTGRSPICEVELELKSGPPAALFDLARELAAAAPLYLAFDSKSARGQALVAGEKTARQSPEVKLADDATVGAAFQTIARKSLAQIAANAAALRAKPTPDIVHQLRVSARRLRSTLSTFKPVIEGEGLEAVKDDLAWLSHRCDRARNLDVFAEETVAPAEAASPASIGLHALRNAIDGARRAAWADAAEAVSSERFRSLMINATGWVETGKWRSRHEAAAPIEPFARRALKRHLRKLSKCGPALRHGDDVGRHHLRIEAKKLRYAAEVLTSLYGEKRTARYLHHLRDLQDVLGRLNDLATAEPLIAAMKLPSDAAFAAGELVGLGVAEKPRMIARACKALDRLEAANPFWR